MEFPRFKKSVSDFLLNEDGKITKNSLIKLGVLSAGSLAAVAPSSLAQSPVQCDTTCPDLIEMGGQPATISAYVDVAEISDCDMDIDDGCSPFHDAVMDKLDAFDITGPANKNAQSESHWSDPSSGHYTTAHIGFLNMHRHTNSISLGVVPDGSQLTGTHSHSIQGNVCSSADLELHMHCYGDADYSRGYCKVTDSDGTEHGEKWSEKVRP